MTAKVVQNIIGANVMNSQVYSSRQRWLERICECDIEITDFIRQIGDYFMDNIPNKI